MQFNLYALLSGLVLAGAVASCSPDQQPQTAQPLAVTPSPSAAAAPPVAPPAPAADASPRPHSSKKITQTTPAKRRPAPTPAPRWVAKTQVAPGNSTTKKLPLPSPKPAVATQLLPDVAAVGQSTTSNSLAPAASAPDPTANNLQAFCAQAGPVAQVFWVRPGRDTVLLGQQGTRLVVPARAFDVPAGSGPVELTMREYYSTPDIVLAGLGTRAGLDLLETGGMLHLHAAANGTTVHLRPDKQLLVQLPTRQLLPGMQLYQGTSIDASHSPDWQLPANSNPTASRAKMDKWVALHPPKSPRWPRFDKGNETLLKEFDRLMPNSKADQAWLRRKRPIDKDEQRMLKDLSRENHTAIRHAVVLDVVADSTGTLQPPVVLAGDSVLAARVLAAVQQLPQQRAASFMSTLPHGRRTISSARGYFSVLYARSGKRLVGFSWLLMDKHLKEELAKEAKRSRADFARQFTSKSNGPLTLEGGLYYELVAGGLGWINCDRLLDPGPRIQFAVQAPAPATVVSLVFKGQRSILASSRTDGNAAIFEQVPSGQAATVVALRREKGITYLATSGVSLGQATPPALQFHPVTLDELRSELAQL